MDGVGVQTAVVGVQPIAQPQQAQAQGVVPMFVQQPVIPVQAAQVDTKSIDQETLDGVIGAKTAKWKAKELEYITQISALTAQLNQSQQQSQSYQTELTGYKQRETATKYGVPAQFMDFAIFSASKLAVNGKSFDDAMKEYVAANGQLFGAAQQVSQPMQSASPTGQQVLPGAVPAQGVPQQQYQQPTQQVVQLSQMAPLKDAAGVVPQQQFIPGAVPQGTVQYGGAGTQLAGNPSSVSATDSAVDDFLKKNGLKK